MGKRVVSGLAPAGKPHPATKWGLLMAMLVVVVLGVPRTALAGLPSVQAPTGTMSGGYFTSVYTFDTYIYCTSGFNFPSSYSNSLEGTHTFAFYGAGDGSLFVAIDGGGYILLTSCGDPFTGGKSHVATYNVTRYAVPPPTPAPTPPPTPAPTPPPTPAPTATPKPGNTGGGNQPSTGATPAPQPGQPTPTPAPGEPTPQATPTPTPGFTPGSGQGATPTPQAAGPVAEPIKTAGYAWLPWALVIMLAALYALWRYRRVVGEWLRHATTPARLRLEALWFKVRHLHSRLPVRGHTEPRRRHVSAHKHTGKILAHHHTSYPSLVFLLVLTAVLTGAVSLQGRAADSSLSLTVTGPAPTTGATIDQPLSGDIVTFSTVTVRGTCPAGLLIEIYRDSTFAGSAICGGTGLYTVLVTLLPGANSLVARTADALGQYGPDSSTVTVTYNVPPPTPTPSVTPAPTATPAPAAPGTTPRPTAKPRPTPAPSTNPLIITSDQRFYQAVDVNTPLAVEVGVTGGAAPYRLMWAWGDGSTSTTQVVAAGQSISGHTYQKAGNYQVTIRARDAAGREAALQLAVIVNGQPAAVPSGTAPWDGGELLFIWPLLVMAFLTVLSFWLGERHELSVQKPWIRRRPVDSQTNSGYALVRPQN